MGDVVESKFAGRGRGRLKEQSYAEDKRRNISLMDLLLQANNNFHFIQFIPTPFPRKALR